MSFTVNQAKPVLDLIGKYESRGDYDAVWGGIPKHVRPTKLTAITLADVIQWQVYWRSIGLASTASGKYQIIYNTLLNTIDQMKISKNVKFNELTQDQMACHLLKGRGFQKFLDGNLGTAEMILNLAKEWASFPVPYAMKGASRNVVAGQSYYAGDGLNKAHASVAEVEAALIAARSRYRSGSTTAPSPSNPGSIGSTADSTSWIVAGFAAVAVALVFFLKG